MDSRGRSCRNTERISAPILFIVLDIIIIILKIIPFFDTKRIFKGIVNGLERCFLFNIFFVVWRINSPFVNQGQRLQSSD